MVIKPRSRNVKMLDCLSINAQDKSVTYCHGNNAEVNLKVIMVDCFCIATKVSGSSVQDKLRVLNIAMITKPRWMSRSQ